PPRIAQLQIVKLCLCPTHATTPQGYESLYHTMSWHLWVIGWVGIRVVIFDNAFQKKLMSTPTGSGLPKILKFSTKKPWVRHDEHYHIDFVFPCAEQIGAIGTDNDF
ncbi:MAG: hypothetical protein WAV07_14340, partial [Candidatus Contendobacter sp.]